MEPTDAAQTKYFALYRFEGSDSYIPRSKLDRMKSGLKNKQRIQLSHYLRKKSSNTLSPEMAYCVQSYKSSTIVNYDSRVVIWGIFKSGTTLES